MKPRSDRDSSALSLEQTIHGAGLRMTDQRRAVLDALMVERNHPTAVDVFTRVRERMPGISLATVYNCLDTLTTCGLVKSVNLDRGPSRYCANLEDHAHFHCVQCGTVLDLPRREAAQPADVWQFPENLSITSHEVAFRGVCPQCAAKDAPKDGETSPTQPISK